MKKIFAFSLAEALITLLIVCLITLASIPVITKKKRDQNSYATGTWMCTKRADGKYVTWYSGDPSGDAKDPETWKVSKYSDKCEFTPPQNARNFGLTLIGGGGGGRDGKIVQEVYIDGKSSTDSYTVNGTAGNFRLAVIGAGGGGHGSDDSDGGTNCGVGGQGGGGAYWMGTIKLSEGDLITANIGQGGEGKYDGGKKCKYGHDANLASTSSFVYVGNTLLLKAGGGQGGQSTRNKGGHDPDCGDGGSGGDLTIEKIFENKYLVSTEKIGTSGSFGRKNANCGWSKYFSSKKCDTTGYPKATGDTTNWNGQNYKTQPTYILFADNRPCYGFQNGISLGDFYSNQDANFYGTGGFGCKYGPSTGFNGDKGTVKLWQIIQQAGEGGKASSLTFHTLPVIKGKLTVEIGDGGLNNENGKPSYVRLYKNDGKLDREFKSTYGVTGGYKDKVALEYVDGDSGQNSEWSSEIGGGQVGKCTPTKRTIATSAGQMTVPVIGDDGDPECELVVCNMRVANKTSPNPSSSVQCPYNANTEPRGLCLACYDTMNMNNCAYDWSNPDNSYVATGSKSIAYEDFLKKVYEYIGDPATTTVAYANLLDFVGYNNDYYFASYYGDDYPAFKDPKDPTSNACDCMKYKTQKIDYKNGESKITEFASCEDSKNGTYFGAGGGGGSASNEVGIYGKGGAGAPGAVIIQW